VGLLPEDCDVSVIGVASSADPWALRRLLVDGAHTYISIDRLGPETLRTCVDLTGDGGVYIARAEVDRILGALHGEFVAAAYSLTERELQVLRLICDGFPNGAIGLRMRLTEQST